MYGHWFRIFILKNIFDKTISWICFLQTSPLCPEFVSLSSTIQKLYNTCTITFLFPLYAKQQKVQQLAINFLIHLNSTSLCPGWSLLTSAIQPTCIVLNLHPYALACITLKCITFLPDWNSFTNVTQHLYASLGNVQSTYRNLKYTVMHHITHSPLEVFKVNMP